ncbi:Os03g0793950, partial [Oryza sativa Japonica Group]
NLVSVQTGPKDKAHKLTVALAGRWGLDAAGAGEQRRACGVHGDAERRRRAAEHHAEAPRARPQHAGQRRAARRRRRRRVPRHVPHAGRQADELRHTPRPAAVRRSNRRRLRRRRRAPPRQERGHHGHADAEHGAIAATTCSHRDDGVHACTDHKKFS